MHKATAVAMAREITLLYVEHQAITLTKIGETGGAQAAELIAALHRDLAVYFEKVKDE